MQSFTWTGEAMIPARPRLADRAYVIGQRYWLDEVSERSWVSHAHQFVWIDKAWDNLPEALVETFPTSEHLRKAALIATGWHRERVINAGSRAAAISVAAYARSEDAFAQVVIRGSTVIVRKARSKRMHGIDRMNKAEFQKSKDDILGWISNLLGVDAERLMKGAA
jgi:hypothetical protein